MLMGFLGCVGAVNEIRCLLGLVRDFMLWCRSSLQYLCTLCPPAPGSQLTLCSQWCKDTCQWERRARVTVS